MRLIKTPPLTAPQHLALDAWILEQAEAGRAGECARLWMSDAYCVCLGRGGQVELECDLARCRADGVPVLRRISGGGAVLLGPGCLNFSVALDYARDPRLRNVGESYHILLGRLCEAFGRRGLRASVMAPSDLAVDGRKISGNAQARKRRHLLHHGTILFDFDLGKIAAYLKPPPREPAYRCGRPHDAFVANLAIDAETLRATVLEAFPSDEGEWPLSERDMGAVRQRADEKFTTDAWNLER